MLFPLLDQNIYYVIEVKQFCKGVLIEAVVTEWIVS
jgi:hypothetical protein